MDMEPNFKIVIHKQKICKRIQLRSKWKVPTDVQGHGQFWILSCFNTNISAKPVCATRLGMLREDDFCNL
jgi:hypothetical protein